MDTQRSPLLSWAYFCQGKNMEDLRQSLLYTSLELETTRLQAQEEVRKRDELLAHLKDVLNKAIKERDEATEKCQKLFLENLILQQQQQQFQQQQAGPLSGVSSIDDEPRRGIDSNNGFSNSDCEESIVSSPVIDPYPQPPPPQPQLPHSQPHHHQQQQQPQPQPQPQPSPPIVEERMQQLVTEKPLPEKGKFLQAVMKAGPLLQTLLLAGPLPQWRHPPPPLESFEIPPVTIPSPPPPPSLLQHQDSISLIINNNNNCSRVNNRKRGLCEGSDSSTESKYQRVLLH